MEERLKHLRELSRIPIIVKHWDPPPPWIRLDDEMLHSFALVEIEFKQKELEFEMEKLEALKEILR